MKTKITALALVAVAALTLAPKPALAGDKTLAVLGGFIGGLIVASELNHHDAYAPAIVVNDRCNDGYWDNVTVRVWVPGCWVIERGHHGRSYRHYREGHYEIRAKRVWVTSHSHNRHDREVSYGYGHRR